MRTDKATQIEQLSAQLRNMVRKSEEGKSPSPSSSQSPLWSDTERARIRTLLPTEEYVARLFGETSLELGDTVLTDEDWVKIEGEVKGQKKRQRVNTRARQQAALPATTATEAI